MKIRTSNNNDDDNDHSYGIKQHEVTLQTLKTAASLRSNTVVGSALTGEGINDLLCLIRRTILTLPKYTNIDCYIPYDSEGSAALALIQHKSIVSSLDYLSGGVHVTGITLIEVAKKIECYDCLTTMPEETMLQLAQEARHWKQLKIGFNDQSYSKRFEKFKDYGDN